MEFSPDILEKYTFASKRWDIFKGKLPPGSDIHHVCIVIHITDNNENISYVYLTSQSNVINYSDKNSILTLNITDIKEYFDAPKTTYIQCGRPYVHTVSARDYNLMVRDKTITRLDYLIKENIRVGIISAIKNSKTHSPRFKAFF
jgi:hypothetical protein